MVWHHRQEGSLPAANHNHDVYGSRCGGRGLAAFLPYYAAPGEIWAGFQHYGKLSVLVLKGEWGLPQASLVAGVRKVAADIIAEIILACGHTMAEGQPEWSAD